ncbi:RagB/SusD family nutrient uptake outer membrane protein [Mucilaginibacter sp. L196]|uniref:RagB/SusD family nutrient uptake outer membrane protein n=1 Tax=Mucilaginibacter sp. L196 TaxID=1641870 RepID=UPI00131EADB0|nr:RagB/SusD family nutrient uptake outer membrane protein [Mucilaginibacter sp. L196]
MKKYIVALVVMGSLITSSCRKYVEIPAVGMHALKYTSDYQDLLNNTSVLEYSYSFPLLSSDDVSIDSIKYQNSFTAQTADVQFVLTYTWAPTRYATNIESDVDWERFYQQIMICNNVSDGVMASEGGTVTQKNAILALALVHRAYAYLNLVNLYAPPYNPSTASTDLGVPLLTTANLFASLKRPPLADVYAQIIKDLTTALPNLPDLPAYNSDPSKAAAYAILAETELEMRNFSDAGTYAGKALALQSTLIDLNAYASAPGTLPGKLLDPETIFSKLSGGYSFNNVTLSGDLLTLLGTKDLRYILFTGLNYGTAAYGRSYYRQNYNSNEDVYIGPNVPEMMLIKAESAARSNDAATAVSLLNALRKKRFKPADYTDLTASNAADALTLVINERRRELFGRGYRWFDMRRLNQDAAFAKTYTRVFKGVIYTLAPNSARYTYQIDNKYILLNPEIVQNP